MCVCVCVCVFVCCYCYLTERGRTFGQGTRAGSELAEFLHVGTWLESAGGPSGKSGLPPRAGQHAHLRALLTAAGTALTMQKTHREPVVNKHIQTTRHQNTHRESVIKIPTENPSSYHSRRTRHYRTDTVNPSSEHPQRIRHRNTHREPVITTPTDNSSS